jgi:hypothetical protein
MDWVQRTMDLPIIAGEEQFMAQPEGARRDSIIANIVADNLRRPEHNIDCNGCKKLIYSL